MKRIKRFLLRHQPFLTLLLLSLRRFRRLKQVSRYCVENPASQTDSDFPEHIPTRLLILVPDPFLMNNFEPAGGNYFFELLHSAQDFFNPDRVSSFFYNSKISFEDNCLLITQKISETRATHLLLPLEFYAPRILPRSKLNVWQWDSLAFMLGRQKSTVSVAFFLADGVYELHQAYCRMFSDLYPNTIFLRVDVADKSKYLDSKNLSGPSFLPFSSVTLAELRSSEGSVLGPRRNRATFLGRVYGDRGRFLRRLCLSGVYIAENPHTKKVFRSENPYVKYMLELRDSEYTLNLARAEGDSTHQLKSRMLESALMGCVTLSDDRKLNEILLKEGQDFLYYDNEHHLKHLIETIPARPNAPSCLEDRRILELATSHFWNTLQSGFEKANLPRI